ncbi:M12 family metallo-peptidase [Bacillus sp. SL00103]
MLFQQRQAQAVKKVTVYAVADAQYRAKYSDWQTRIVSIIEQADVTFNRDHDVTLSYKQ